MQHPLTSYDQGIIHSFTHWEGHLRELVNQGNGWENSETMSSPALVLEPRASEEVLP